MNLNLDWEIKDNILICKNNKKDLTNQKIAAFDLDDTLIKTKSKKIFAENENDWELFDSCVSNKLTKLNSEGYCLVIITNQLGIGKGKVDINMWQTKIKNIINFLGLEFTLIASLKDDYYRKPKDKLWDLIKGDKNNSFYCGDAGGLKKRIIKNTNLNKDFSDSDLKFAYNLGVKFIHRDEFIFDVIYTKETYNINYPFNFNKMNNTIVEFKPNQPEVIINVGLPASGKSSFYKNKIFKYNYFYINQDKLKTQKKCIEAFENALKNNLSVVVDNTNLTKQIRKTFIEISKKYSVKCRCLNFITPLEVCVHNSNFRNYQTHGAIKIIPSIVYNIMKKSYEKPELNEGFYEINNIDFCLDLSPEEINSYCKYYS